MYRRLVFCCISFIISLLMLTYYQQQSYAANPSRTTEIRAKVGEFVLSVYGYASPNASILLKSDNTLLSTGTADAKGNFSFIKIPIKRGFSGFCLQAVDQRRLGESTTCLTVPGATADVLMRDIFLAPTIGLEKSTITVGSSGLAYGYTMAGARVNLSVGANPTLQTTADTSGRYSYTIGHLTPGEYSIAAKAEYQGKPSLDPSKSLTLRVLTSSQTFSNDAVGLRRALQQWLIWIALIGIVGLPLLTYLIYRLRPGWFTFITTSKFFVYLERKRHRKLHHAWFVGY